MNILSIYFSGTNNVKYINDLIKQGISKEHRVDEIRITDNGVEPSNYVFSNYDLFILGAPVYVEVYPKIFTDFIKTNLKDISGKKIILYQSASHENPPAISELYKFFVKNNEIVCMSGFAMINNFYMSGTFKYTDDEVRKLKFKVCENKVSEIVKVINGEQKSFIDYQVNINRYRVGRFIYNLLEKGYLRKYAIKNFSSSSECTACGVCKRECPSSNIEVDKIGKSIKYDNNCVACMRCIHICPNDAIYYRNEKIQKMNMF